MTFSTSVDPIVIRGISKTFGHTAALRNVSLVGRAGSIHAITGENGAGKSTLIKLLSGIHPHGSYEGQFEVNGVEACFETIKDAEKAGLAVIYQELALVEGMTVAENIFLGSEPRRRGLIDWPRVYRQARELLERFDIARLRRSKAVSLSGGERRRLEIARCSAVV